MGLKLYDTWTRSIREFEPLTSPEVKMYCCGPTVYNYAHIGNLRTYLFEDLLRRALEFNGFTCKHVVNITDVGHLVSDADVGEDKMEQGSKRTGKTAWQIAEEYTIAFKADLQKLNIIDPTIWSRATDHIPEQIEMIKIIEAKGFTYKTSDGIYFDTSKLDTYGYLARLDIEGLRSGARVDLGEKRNPTDFSLWKFSPSGEKRQMEWESPWGIGFPGWHIECSAMSAKHLGTYFDIHCGGEDHIPVHHSNEIAQTQAAYNTRLANFWIHGYFLQMKDAKMSKSSGEFLRLQVLIDKNIDPLAYRYMCLGAHYRTLLNFSWDSLTSAQTSLDRLRTALYDLPNGGEIEKTKFAEFTAFINDDLNLPRALALTWEVLRSDLPANTRKATILAFDAIFGLRLSDWQPTADAIPAEIQELLNARQTARADKRWKDADIARDAILAQGWEIKDTPQGPQLKKNHG